VITVNIIYVVALIAVTLLVGFGLGVLYVDARLRRQRWRVRRAQRWQAEATRRAGLLGLAVDLMAATRSYPLTGTPGPDPGHAGRTASGDEPEWTL
jgi:hypothetical protein